MLTLSAGGIGLLVTLLTTADAISLLVLILAVLACIILFVTIVLVLRIFDRNALYLRALLDPERNEPSKQENEKPYTTS